MKWAPGRSLFVHPSESTPARFAAWLVLSGMATACVAQLFGGGGWAFFLGMMLLGGAAYAVPPPRDWDRDSSLAWLGVAIAFLVILVAVGLILTFETNLAFLEPNVESRPSARVMPFWYKVLVWSTWLFYVAFEVRRYYAKRSRSAA